jgi:predicted nucleic acid-binding protein
LENVTICNITPEVMKQTTHCLENHTLRAMDAIQIIKLRVKQALNYCKTLEKPLLATHKRH